MTEIILDSNVIITAAKGDLNLAVLRGQALYVSDISRLEVFGYHQLSLSENAALEDFFANVQILEISKLVISEAILLRQEKKMSTGDAIIAATAQIMQFPLYTANIKDFQHIESLQLINPFEE